MPKFAMIAIALVVGACGVSDEFENEISKTELPLSFFTNDDIAGTALSYDTADMSFGGYGQCKAFVQAVINQELGGYLGTGYCQAYLNAGTEVSGGLSNAVRGDIIQINTASTQNYCTSYNNSTFLTGMHTAIFLERNADGTVKVVDSNYGSDEKVSVHDWNVSPRAGLYVHVYRLGSTAQKNYINNAYLDIDPINSWTAKPCRGITGGSSTNWVYSCTSESHSYRRYQNVYILGGIHNVRKHHHYKVVFYRNGSYYTTKYSNWNWVNSSSVWEHSYTWPSLYLTATGTYKAYIYVDMYYNYSDDWEFLDYVYFSVN